MKIRPEALAHAKRILDQFRADGATGPDGSVIRADAGETAALARALEYIRSAAYEVKYAQFRAREFIPPATDIPVGAQSWTYRIWDWRGMAKIISSGATDLPTVELMGKEVTNPIRSIGNAYDYDIQDVRAAQMLGISLDPSKSKAARRANEHTVEIVASVGDTASGLPGMLNNASVPLVLPADATFTAGWASATAPEILTDMHYVSNKISIQSKGVHAADTMILSPAMYNIVATKRLDTVSDTTVLESFLRTNPYVKNVDQWEVLATADVAGTGSRGVVYERTSEVLELVEPVGFEQLPPQPKGLGFHVPCHSRIGGTVIKYPLGMVYFDNV